MFIPLPIPAPGLCSKRRNVWTTTLHGEPVGGEETVRGRHPPASCRPSPTRHYGRRAPLSTALPWRADNVGIHSPPLPCRLRRQREPPRAQPQLLPD
ncbi:hypothetical protein C8T65DRAFT_216450 [Cerioporus squamosus]|nr:hypothetical protein C8T65DRAFT_216450 [Cerioporus squamosus]